MTVLMFIQCTQVLCWLVYTSLKIMGLDMFPKGRRDGFS